MLGALGVSVWQFVRGIARRSYYWLFALLLDPADLYNRYIRQPDWPEFDMPVSWFWIVLSALVFWTALLTYHELRTKHEKPLKTESVDARALKLEILEAAANRLAPAVHALNDALRAHKQVFQTEWPSNPLTDLSQEGVERGVLGSMALGQIVHPEWVQSHSLDTAMVTFAAAADDYRIAREKLNMACAALLTKDAIISMLRDNRTKRGLGDIMRDWWTADVRWRQQLTAFSLDARLQRIKGNLVTLTRERERFPISNFTDALAKFWKESA